jgi:hypothetical protein
MILLSKLLNDILIETLTYNQLFSASSLYRKQRAKGMKVERVTVNPASTNNSWEFKYKSSPSNNTTGQMWEGRITFIKTDKGRNAGDIPCMVDCSCPDFKYRFAFANNKHDASPIGSDSLNNCTNTPPNVRNPQQKIGLCKHLVALKNDLHKKLRESTNPANSLDEIVKNGNYDCDVI